MPDEVRELPVAEASLMKLAARGIGTHDAEEVLRNAHVTVRNSRGGSPATRRLLIGRTDGGRCLTLVSERTLDESTWLIVTGWSSTDAERRILRD